jgi:PmbA protein
VDILTRLREKTEQAEVFTFEGESTLVSFEANAIKSVEVEETQGVALRCVLSGRLGFTAASGHVSEDQLIANLLASAQYGDEVPIALPAPAAGPAVETYDPALAEVPLERLVDIGREIIAHILEVDGAAQVYVSLERSIGRSMLRNSAGTETNEQGSNLTIEIGVERVRGDDVLLVDDSVSDISLNDAYQEAIRRLTRKISLARRSARLASGRMKVLFSPAGAMVLMLPLMLGTNGKNVLHGASPLADRLGQAVLDPGLTLWDDPTLRGRPESSRFDDEGVPCRPKALIQQGVCASFLYDLKTAALMGTQSTGNGARGLFSAPTPSPSNLVLASGEAPLASILAGIEHGLLVEDVLGLGQGNAMSGAFSNTLGLAYVVEGGEIVGRVKDVSVAGNIYEDLREVAAISAENYWVNGDMQLPYLLLPALNVTCQE